MPRRDARAVPPTNLLGDYIRRRHAELGMSFRRLVAATEGVVSKTTLEYMVKGRRRSPITREQADALGAALKTDPEYLMELSLSDTGRSIYEHQLDDETTEFLGVLGKADAQARSIALAAARAALEAAMRRRED